MSPKVTMLGFRLAQLCTPRTSRRCVIKLCIAQFSLVFILCVAVYALEKHRGVALSSVGGIEIIRKYRLADTELKWNEAKLSAHNIDMRRTRTLFSSNLGVDFLATLREGDSANRKGPDPNSIAIGCAITSRGIESNVNLTEKAWIEKIWHLPFFSQLLPSFCKTASTGFNYLFYFGHDHDDPWLSQNEARQAFRYFFRDLTKVLCKDSARLHVTFVQCNDSGKPAKAQNDAMVQAYKDGTAAFFYRVNDDTVLVTAGWTEVFIGVLSDFEPPLLGVVGPSFIAEGPANFDILTYDFVHRTHLDVFGFYYPPLLTTWYADDWITLVYQPGRCVKVNDITITHTQKLGRRYDMDDADYDIKKQLHDEISRDRETLVLWVKGQHWWHNSL